MALVRKNFALGSSSPYDPGSTSFKGSEKEFYADWLVDSDATDRDLEYVDALAISRDRILSRFEAERKRTPVKFDEKKYQADRKREERKVQEKAAARQKKLKDEYGGRITRGMAAKFVQKEAYQPRAKTAAVSNASSSSRHSSDQSDKTESADFQVVVYENNQQVIKAVTAKEVMKSVLQKDQAMQKEYHTFLADLISATACVPIGVFVRGLQNSQVIADFAQGMAQNMFAGTSDAALKWLITSDYNRRVDFEKKVDKLFSVKQGAYDLEKLNHLVKTQVPFRWAMWVSQVFLYYFRQGNAIPRSETSRTGGKVKSAKRSNTSSSGGSSRSSGSSSSSSGSSSSKSSSRTRYSDDQVRQWITFLIYLVSRCLDMNVDVFALCVPGLSTVEKQILVDGLRQFDTTDFARDYYMCWVPKMIENSRSKSVSVSNILAGKRKRARSISSARIAFYKEAHRRGRRYLEMRERSRQDRMRKQKRLKYQISSNGKRKEGVRKSNSRSSSSLTSLGSISFSSLSSLSKKSSSKHVRKTRRTQMPRLPYHALKSKDRKIFSS